MLKWRKEDYPGETAAAPMRFFSATVAVLGLWVCISPPEEIISANLDVSDTNCILKIIFTFPFSYFELF